MMRVFGFRVGVVQTVEFLLFLSKMRVQAQGFKRSGARQFLPKEV